MVCKTRTGFTIVELVIVIAVIAILAAVLIPTFSSIIGKARESSAIQTVHSAVKTFVSSGGSVEPGTFVYVEYREDGELYQFRFDGHETTRVPKDEVLDFDVSTTKYPFAAVYTLNPAKNGDFDPVKHYNYVFCAGTTYYICYSSGTVADGVSFFVPADPSSEVFVLIKSAGNWELVSLWKEESMENGESLICGYPEPEEEDDDPISAAVLMRYFLSDLLPIMSSSQDPGSEEYFLNGVTEITRAMLAGYTAITTITIPASVTSVADDAFGGLPNLCSIEVDPANPYFTSLDGVLFSKDGKTLIRYPRAKSGDYAIPNGVTGIASNSFGQCHGITRFWKE